MNLITENLVKAIRCRYQSKVDLSQSKVNNLLSQKKVANKADLVDRAYNALLGNHVWRLCYKTFIVEFHEYRRSIGLPINPSSSEAFDAYVASINKNTLDLWFSKYVILGQMIERVVDNSIQYIEEIIRNYVKDEKKLLLKGLIKNDDCLDKLILLDSDPHKKSKVALYFEYSSRNKLVYKPRSLALDISISNLFERGLKIEDLGIKNPIVNTLDCGEYGWQAYVEHQPVEERHIGAAFKNLGVCSALFTGIGATDLHDENVIFSGESPYFIDLETCLRPSNRVEATCLNSTMSETILSSVVSTSILAAKMPTLPHQVLIGAINTPYPQKSNEKLFSIKHLGTDAIDIAKTELEISRPALPIRTFGDKSIDPVPYQREFVEGYELGYRKMMNRRHIISDMIKNLRCQVRFILRPTSQYAFMLNALLFPENLVDQQAADKLLAYLKPTKIVSNSKVARDILLEEKKDILLGDIPYFTLNSNSTSLQSPRMVFESSFDLSTIENARLAIEGMSEVRLQHDKRLVAEGFCQIKIHEAEYLSKGHIGYESDLFKNILSQVTVENPDVLTDFVASMGIKTKGEGQETGWFSGVYGDYPLSYDSKAFISLHDSGGILLLFDHITKENVKYRDLFESAKRGLISQKNLMSVHYDTIHSIISGRASFDYILEHNQKRMIKLEQELDGLIGHEDMVGDVYMGAMGLALLAGSFKATNRDLLKKTYDWLKKVSFEESKAGIAHGHLGRLWTLFRLSYQLEDIESSRAYYQIVIELDFIADGYCNGKAGHLMIVAEMQALLNLESTAYGLALNATQLVDGQVIDISTCHGVSGILQAILFAYKTSGDERLLGLARGYWTKCLVMAQKNGYMTGEENRDYIMGYFLGWSGFSDSANLLDMYLKGHKPWVPLNLSGDIYQDIKGGMNEMFGCD